MTPSTSCVPSTGGDVPNRTKTYRAQVIVKPKALAVVTTLVTNCGFKPSVTNRRLAEIVFDGSDHEKMSTVLQDLRTYLQKDYVTGWISPT